MDVELEWMTRSPRASRSKGLRGVTAGVGVDQASLSEQDESALEGGEKGLGEKASWGVGRGVELD